MTATVRIQVWSDYVCPFCVLEEPVLDEVARVFGNDVDIQWRAYELRPDPVPTLEPDGEYLHSIWARAVYPMAEERGMPLRLPPLQPRSRLAHAAERHARTQGRGDAMRSAIFRAFFEDGRDIGDIDVLVSIGEQVGVDAAALRASLERGEHDESVRADHREAEDLGVQGVPALLIQREGDDTDRAILISGAQAFDTVRRAIETVQSAD